MTEHVQITDNLQPPVPLSDEDPWVARDRQREELITTLNGLDGIELEAALAAQYQSVVDATLDNGGNTEDVGTALMNFSHELRFPPPKFTRTEGGVIVDDPQQRLSATFGEKLNDYRLRLKLIEDNKYRISQVETAVNLNMGQIKREWFSYQDVLEGDEQRQGALEYTERSESADKYARALAKEIVKGNGQDIEDAKSRIRSIFDETVNKLPDNVKSGFSPFAGSESWVYWDIAKQKYLADHPPISEKEYNGRAKYDEHDPLEKEGAYFSKDAEWTQQTIAWRHLGWEVQQMAKNGVDMEWLKKFPEAAPYLLAPTKENGQLHSWQYAALGRVVAQAADSYDYMRQR